MTEKNTSKKINTKPFYKSLYASCSQLADRFKFNIYLYYDGFKGKKLTAASPQARTSPSILVNTPSGDISQLPGINRVVMQVFKHLAQNNSDVLPVQYWRDTLITNHNYAALVQGNPVPDHEEYIDFLAGDKIFLLHSGWGRYESLNKFLPLMHRKEVKVCALVHDLLPIQHPELSTTSFRALYENWIRVIIQGCDSIICVSRTTADVVARYYEEQKIQRQRPLEISYFHLGANFIVQAEESKVREEIKQFVQKPDQKTILMVGKLTLRKGHGVALKAFAQLLQEEYPVQLLIFGRPGEHNIDMAKNLQENEIFTGKVLWFPDATDIEVAWAYQHTSALLEASFDEGFGLPLVEAAHYGLPIICSDIPIFHEVAGASATYFKAWDATALRQVVIAWLQQDQHPDTTKVRIYSWDESAGEINDILTGKTKPYKLLLP